ncbi:MAG: dihydrofolate reductase family protein [Spirochaetales bacterium]|nr:dihydrofolate reductase family protein [Spirochaetales bacterium]
MKKLIYHIATSVDGFIADTGGSVNGFLMEGEHADDFKQSLSAYDTVVMGRKTYEFAFLFGLKPGEPAYPGLKHYIISSWLRFESNDQVVSVPTDGVGCVRALKEEPGKHIWLCGGGHLAGSLLRAGLIDELILKVNPILLGDGIKLFEGGPAQSRWNLQETNTYRNGVVLQRYESMR